MNKWGIWLFVLLFLFSLRFVLCASTNVDQRLVDEMKRLIEKSGPVHGLSVSSQKKIEAD